MVPLFEDRAFAILKPFLQKNIDMEKIRLTVRKFYGQIGYI